MVKMNMPTHQRGKGLFISRKSSSQTWPLVPSLLISILILLVRHNSNAQPNIPSKEMAVMNIGQKLLVKSLILFSFGFTATCVAVFIYSLLSLLVFKRQIGGIFKVWCVSALPNPNQNAYENDEAKDGG